MYDEFEDSLEMSRALLGGNEGASDLWEANDYANRALRMRPNDAEAWMLKCQILSALEDDPAALAAAEIAQRRGALLARRGARRHGALRRRAEVARARVPQPRRRRRVAARGPLLREGRGARRHRPSGRGARGLRGRPQALPRFADPQGRYGADPPRAAAANLQGP